ncbi:hypothetical protein MTR67_011276 [Solanum verrucosum]|uniref:Uncharacterized protein n=1 Tax=Solanum verrucosum TaxID=315347 RepID=A0AAF0QCC6_SOLVR|nr:hypothetical protein MTR67_011276 [Solanum verrucosum]
MKKLKSGDLISIYMVQKSFH